MAYRSIELKKRMRAGEVTFGSWLSFGGAPIAEILAGVGYDWVLIDTEHGVFTNDTLLTTLVAFAHSDTVPIVRVPSNNPVTIKQALDLGADGIMIPMVGSVAEARAAVSACKYPPGGTRGAGPLRAADYGRIADEYFARANDSVIVMPQIEHIDAVKVVDDILGVPGIDVICVGPTDLSGSAGLLGQFNHPAVKGAIDIVVAAASAHGIPACLGIEFPDDETARLIASGATFVVAGDDVASLLNGFTNSLARARSVAAKLSHV